MSINDIMRYYSDKKTKDKLKTLSKQVNSLKKKNSIKRPQKKQTLTNAIIVLIAYYSGMTEGSEINLKKAKRIMIKFRTKGYENIRKKLSDIESLKTVKNLNIVCKYFEDKGDKISLSKALKDREIAENNALK